MITISTFISSKNALGSDRFITCGIKFPLIQILPSYFKGFGHVSLLSGILNASTYLGSAISTYGIALINKNYGWTITVYIWAIIALIGVIASLIIFKKWNKFKQK